MNFWTPTFHSWGKGLEVEDMPWYLLFDDVEVYTFNVESNEFDLHWRDDFNAFDSGRWHKASGTFASNSSEFHSANAYTENGNLVLKMEREEGQENAPALHNLGKHFPKQPLHAKEGHADSIEIPPVHDAFVDSHLFGKHSSHHSEKHLVKHHEKQYIDHHDDYYAD